MKESIKQCEQNAKDLHELLYNGNENINFSIKKKKKFYLLIFLIFQTDKMYFKMNFYYSQMEN